MRAESDSRSMAIAIPRRQPSTDRSYVGERLDAGCFVRAAGPEGDHVLMAPSGRPLWDVRWGTADFTSWELAWAMIFDASGDGQLADDWAPTFGATVVARLPPEGFVLSADDVVAWLEWPPGLLPADHSYV